VEAVRGTYTLTLAAADVGSYTEREGTRTLVERQPGAVPSAQFPPRGGRRLGSALKPPPELHDDCYQTRPTPHGTSPR
jgi:hypothetical protein